MPRGAAAHDRPSAEEVLRAAVYWFSWLLIHGLLAITMPLCWFGKELVAGRQTIRAKVKREFVAQMLHSPAPVLW